MGGKWHCTLYIVCIKLLQELLFLLQEYVYPDVSGGPQHQYPHQDLEESEGEQSESEEDTRLQGPMGCALTVTSTQEV